MMSNSGRAAGQLILMRGIRAGAPARIVSRSLARSASNAGATRTACMCIWGPADLPEWPIFPRGVPRVTMTYEMSSSPYSTQIELL